MAAAPAAAVAAPAAAVDRLLPMESDSSTFSLRKGGREAAFLLLVARVIGLWLGGCAAVR